MTTLDVTDASFQADVLERSMTTPVVIDLWAEWCGPCKTLGPILEQVIGETNGQVVLAKVDVDSNPAIGQAFRVQSIPAVFAMVGGQIVDGFTGAVGEREVRDFVARLLPSEEQLAVADLIAAGDEASLRVALNIDPANEDAIVALATLLVERGDEGDTEAALALLERIPESDRTRQVAARARLGTTPDDDHDATLTTLLDRVKDDDEARQQFVDILELMGPHDPRTAQYRKLLSQRLF
ncbi:MAG TPA: tetratricopeptide repeat protein [Ilumatobacter sp.]|nr:tetratricopeptide repeat protein [Ilumatobacter sp.]